MNTPICQHEFAAPFQVEYEPAKNRYLATLTGGPSFFESVLSDQSPEAHLKAACACLRWWLENTTYDKCVLGHAKNGKIISR